MQSLIEKIGSASRALELTCDGLERCSKLPNFRVDMGTFGDYHRSEYGDPKDDLCFGCAATCALLEAEHIDPTPDVVRAIGNCEFGDYDTTTVEEFESAINCARGGCVCELIALFGRDDVRKWDDLWYMGNHNWREQLPAVRNAIVDMRAVGL